MSLILPEWVAHYSDDKKKRSTIFSISVHPDGSRLATAGLDTKIRIWQTQLILSPLDTEKDDQSSHKLLSTLSRHSGSVLIVRWSKSGRFLASGSDDTVALVWDLDPSGMGGGGSFGSTDVNVETWRPFRRLAAHESDVVDLAWSEEDEFLATVGLDSMVYIWSGSSFDKLKKIDGHQGFVKGVVFDPLGQYLATASDDKSVKIWRTQDWALEAEVTDPFASSPSTTFFRRSSWSPDGNLLLCANAMSGPVFVASVVKRLDWSSDIYFVGHENAVVVTAFSPKIFVGFDGGTHSCVVALGSLDQSVSIWVTGLEQPILVARDVFERQVMDLSWSADGFTLYACSSDGTVAVFNLTPELISEALGQDRLQQARAKHGFKRARPQLSSQTSATPIGTADRPNILQVRKSGQVKVPRAGETPVPIQPPFGSGRSERLQQQITTTKDGKRRIKPTWHGEDGLPLTQPCSQPVPTTVSSNHSDMPHMPPSQGGTTTIGFSSDQPAAYNQGWQMAASHSNANVMAMPSMPPAINTMGMAIPMIMTEEMFSLFQEQVFRGQKRKASLMENDEDIEPLSKLHKGKTKSEVGRTLGANASRTSTGAPATIRRRIQGSVGIVEDGVQKGVRLAVPELLSVYRRDEEGGTIEVCNFQETRPTQISSIDTGDRDRVVWMDFSPTPAILATITCHFAAVAFEDATLTVYSCKGRRLNTFQMDSPCYKLEANGTVLLAITISGQMHRWDVGQNKEVHRPVSVLHLLGDPDHLVLASIHPNGAPIIILKTEKAYTFDGRNNVWVCICDGWWAEHSSAWDGRNRSRGVDLNSNRDPVKAIEAEINTLVVSRTLGEVSAAAVTATAPAVAPPPPPPTTATATATATAATEESEKEDAISSTMSVPSELKADFQLSVTLRHLETRMLAATLLESANEYKNSLIAYSKKLAEEGIRNQAEDLIKSLLGPIYYKGCDETWEPTVVGLDKRQLLSTVLPILAKPKLLSGLVQPYQEILGNLKG